MKTLKLLIATTLIFTSVAHADDKLIEKAQEVIKSSLLDPFSAVFVDAEVVARNGQTAVCGLVNAKNRYGAYTGNKLYYVAFENGKPVDMDFILTVQEIKSAYRSGDPVLIEETKRRVNQITKYCGEDK